MSVSTTVKIGKDVVDLCVPGDVLDALRKIEISIVTGGKAETVRFGDDEVTFTRANLGRLAELIRTYEDRCARAAGKKRTRYALRPRWF